MMAGVKVVCGFDIDEQCMARFRKVTGAVPLGDFRLLVYDRMPWTMVYTGESPCTTYGIAGFQTGDSEETLVP